MIAIAQAYLCMTLLNAGAADAEKSTPLVEITVSTGLPVLPAPVRSFFERHRDTLAVAVRAAEIGSKERSEGTNERSRRDKTGPLDRGRPAVRRLPASSTFLTLDADWHVDPAVRSENVERFPHARRDARAFFKQLGIHDRDGGTLPWEIERQRRRLIDAFRAADADLVIAHAGNIFRLSAASAIPFNTTTDREGVRTGNLNWTSSESTQSTHPHRNIRARCDVLLIEHLLDRLAFESRIHPDRLQPTTDPIEATFGVMGRSYGALQSLLRIDRDAVAALQIADAPGFLMAEDCYYARVASAAVAIFEARIEDGALLAANLIAGAWIESGRPPLNEDPMAKAVDEDAITETTLGEPAPFANAQLVGSRNSTKFHTPGCVHAKRIKAENVVTFATAAEAKRAGRSWCSVCKPKPDG